MASMIPGLVVWLTIALLWAGWNPLFNLLERYEHGPMIGLIGVTLVILSAVTAWARGIMRSPVGVKWPEPLRKPMTIFLLGLPFPGLGQLIAGRRWRCGFTVWSFGLLLTGFIVALQCLRFAARSRAALSLEMEALYLVALAGMALGLLAWLISALDGMRVMSSSSRSGKTGDALALFLLIALLAFFSTLKPASLARDLESEGLRMQERGLRVLPLTLYQAASNLDHSTPDYLVRAAALHDDLGHRRQAQATRDLLLQRAARFAQAVNGQLIREDPMTISTGTPAAMIANPIREQGWWISP